MNKVSYEQLEKTASHWYNEANNLYRRLEEAQRVIDNVNVIGLLTSLLEKEDFFEEKFIHRCSDKVQELVSGLLDGMDSSQKTRESDEQDNKSDKD